MILVIHWNNGDWYAFNNVPFSMRASGKTLVMTYGNFSRSVKLKEMPLLEDGKDILHVYAETNTWIEEIEE